MRGGSMRIMMKLFVAGLAAFTLAAPGTVAAFSYNEATLGDIADGSTTFDLDFGANAIFGTVGNVGGLNLDRFAATVPTNAILVSIELLMFESDSGTAGYPSTLAVVGNGGSFIGTTPLSGGGSYLFDFNTPVTGFNFIGLDGLMIQGIDVEYELTINLRDGSISQIPLPATGLLYVGALVLGGAAWRRRRRLA